MKRIFLDRFWPYTGENGSVTIRILEYLLQTNSKLDLMTGWTLSHWMIHGDKDSFQLVSNLFKNTSFSPSCYSKKMRWGRGWLVSGFLSKLIMKDLGISNFSTLAVNFYWKEEFSLLLYWFWISTLVDVYFRRRKSTHLNKIEPNLEI